MEYKEKYKNVMEILKKAASDPECEDERFCCVIYDLFPELKESEDERTRKEILNVFKQLYEDTTICGRNYDYTKWIAWLEKQKHLENYDEAEKEKADFVGDGFIRCHADFLDFKEGNTYWLEYIGDDKYNVRSDNLLGKMYHITPCQLYTIFKKQTWLEKQGEKKQETNYPKFTFNDVLALQCCMETVKKVQEDKDLYEKLNDLHGRVYDAYHLEKQGEPTGNDMVEALRTEYEKGRADVLRCIDPDEMVADFCSQPLSKTRSLASIYRQGIIDILKRINRNKETSINSTHSIDDVGL